MNKSFRIPPKTVEELSTPFDLVKKLSCIIGTEFFLTKKTRTDGSNIRKLVASVLEKYPLPIGANEDEYEIMIPKGKGIPKITREFIDTYIVTSGKSYNLQVWNRLPASNTLLIRLDAEKSLKCNDVRFVFVRIDITKNIISSIIILTPEYIESKFGKFGKPTIKHQLLISNKTRKEIYKSKPKILFFPDSNKLSYLIKHDFEIPKSNMVSDPSKNEIFSMKILKEKIALKLIGIKLDSAATKTRGQALERLVIQLLGYQEDESALLFGGFPDIRNQLLEVKVQDSPTVDLGKFSPEMEEVVIKELNITTKDIRYLIALTNPETEIIEGIILAPGERLGDVFSYISDKSYKCQRSIPMSFFDKYKGRTVFNPD